MSAVRWWFRTDVRRRWRSLAVLAVLTAVSLATVLTAAAGARRGSTAVDRLMTTTRPATIAVLPNQVGFDWEAVRKLSTVESLGTFVVGSFGIDGLRPNSAAFPLGDDESLRTIERPIVLDGRMLDPTRLDEAVVTADLVRTQHRGIGDHVTFRLYSAKQLSAGAAAFDEPPAGRAVRATIVGVVRSPWYADTESEDGVVIPSPELFARYPDEFIGNPPSGYLNALVRLRHGAADIPEFGRQLAKVSGRDDIDFMNLSDKLARYDDVTGFEATALAMFAAAAALTALFLVGQAVTRYAGATVGDLETMQAMGLRPVEVRVAAALGPLVAVAVGSAVAVAGTIVASNWFPIGSAAPVEPSPGVDVDVPVLVVGVLAALALTALASAWSAARALSASRSRTAGRASALADLAARATGWIPVAIGARFALEPGVGRTRVAVRPALAGAIAGVLGVVAALTFSAAIDDATAHPERFGQTHQLESFIGFAGDDFVPPDVGAAVAKLRGVESVNDTRTDVVRVGSTPLSILSYAPVGRPLDLVLVSGHRPTTAGEIALAPRTAQALGAAVGDKLDVVGSAGSRTLTVSGISFVVGFSHNDYASGAWILPDAFDALTKGFKFHSLVVELKPGVSPKQVVAAARAAQLPDMSAPTIPPERAQLLEVRALPTFLAAFLALVALGAVGHAVATSVGRRRGDLAVLRSLGLTSWQLRLIVVTQSTVLTLVGLAVGVPVGLAVGRTVWRLTADRTPVLYVPPTVWFALIAVIGIALLATNLLASLPARRASSTRAAHILRVE
ncbi:MAG: FtsX-like permease family protein [Acidimicrobiales bacterium]